MYIKSCLLYAFVIFSVIYGKPTSFPDVLIHLASNQCPHYMSLAKPLFIEDCVYTPELQIDHIDWKNEKIALCFMYYKVFENFCESTNYTFFKKWDRDLEKEFEQVSKELSTNGSEVCNSLKLISPKLLPLALTEVLKSPVKCLHLCTDLDDKVLNVCSLTSFIWNLTESFSTIENRSAIKQTLAVTETLSLPQSKPSNVNSSSINIPNNRSKDVESKSTQQNTKEQKYQETNDSIDNGILSTPITNAKTDKSVLPEENPIQTGEAMSEEKVLKQTSSATMSTVHNDKPLAGIIVPVPNKTEIHLTELSTIENVQKSIGVSTTEKSKAKNNELVGEELQSVKSKITVPQEEKKEDKKEETKADDLNIYDQGDEEGIESNEPPPPQKVTNANEDKPKDDGYELLSPKSSEVKAKVEVSKPKEIDEDSFNFAANFQNQNIDDSNSYFFSYFMMICVLFICGYVAYHNKQKILALVLEGRKGRRHSRTRRPNSSNYRKLDSTLEEAVTSSCNKNTTQVIY